MSNENTSISIDSEKIVSKSYWEYWGNIWDFIGKHERQLTLLIALLALGTTLWVVWLQNTASRDLASQQNFIQFYAQWESEGMQERRARLASALLENREPENVDDSPLVFLETLSNAYQRGLLDRELVWNTFYMDVENYWAASQDYTKKIREKEQCTCIFEELEKFSKILNDEAQKRGQSVPIGQDIESVNRFLELERKRQLPEKRPE